MTAYCGLWLPPQCSYCTTQCVGLRTGVNRIPFPCDITSSRPDVFHCEADWKVAKDARKVVPVLSEVPHRDDVAGGSGSVASRIICVSTRLRWMVTELRWEIVTVIGFPVVSCRTTACILHWCLWSITNCLCSSDNEDFCYNYKAECDFFYASTKMYVIYVMFCVPSRGHDR